MFNSAIRETPWGANLVNDAPEGSSRPGPLCLPDGETIRPFDLQNEDKNRLIELKEEVYDRPVDRAVFDWEYFRHPRARHIRVFVVEHDRRIVAATTRLPAAIRLSGVNYPAHFNIDSMVHPDQRRRGRMRDLYLFARASMPSNAIGFSKGSSPNIYPLLLSIGHREILPNTFLVSYPSATRWLMTRLHLRAASSRPLQSAEPARIPTGFEDFRQIERFGADFDVFFERVSQKLDGVFVRDAAYMNWRYIDIPHRRYLAFERVVGDKTVAVVVLSVSGDHGNLVDLLWEPGGEGDPERCVRFAKAMFEEQRAVRVACFATHPALREALSRAGFVDRGESPRFSAHVPAATEGAFQLSPDLHVTDGDGDTEFS